MASESDKGRRRARRILGTALAALASLAVFLLVAAGWLLFTESGARAAFSLVAAASGNAVLAQGVHGRLAGPLRVESLVFDSTARTVSAERLQLEWQPQALFDRELHVNTLHIGRLRVVEKPQPRNEPAKLPDTIAAPIRLRVDRVRIDGGEAGPVSLGAVSFTLDFDGARYRVELQRLAARARADEVAFGGNFKGEATLSVASPYPIQADLSSGAEATIRQQLLAATGHLSVDGTLAEMAAAVDLAIGSARVSGHALLRPFSPRLLGAADLAAQDVDLAAFRRDLPRTQLNGKLSMSEEGSGEAMVANAEAGPYNDKRIPVSELRLAFRRHDGDFAFERIAADLGSATRPAGRLGGSGAYAGGSLTLDLALNGVDLRGLDTRLRTTRLAGPVAIRSDAARQEFSIDLAEPLKKQTASLAAHALLSGGSLTVDRALLRLGNGRIDASGRYEMSGAQAFEARGKVSRLGSKDIGDFAQVPDLFLNAEFSLAGSRQPQLTAGLDFTIHDSRIAGQPLQGEGKARLRADAIDISKLALTAGANRLNIDGRLSQDGGQLSFALAAPRLDQLWPDLAGVLQVNGVASGSFSQPSISASWSAGNVRLGGKLQVGDAQGKADVRLARGKTMLVDAATLDASAHGIVSGGQRLSALTAQLRFSPRPDAPLSLALNAQGIAAGAVRADSFSASASGTTGRHVLDFTLDEPHQTWTGRANGGLALRGGSAQWQGDIERFDAAGQFIAHLAAPASLLVSRQSVQLERFRLDAAVGRLAVEHFARDASGIVTRGTIERLQIGQVLRFTSPEPAVATDLQVSGDWNLSLTDTPSGTARLRRDGGDIVMHGRAPVALGLRSLDASASLSAGKLSVQMRAEGRQLGSIEASGSTVIAGRFELPQEAPLSGAVRIDVPSLAWAGSLVSPTLVAEGRLQSMVAVSGTVSQPHLSGQISGSALRLLFADLGVDLRSGMLDAEFQESKLVLKSLRFGPADGALIAAGQVDFAQRRPQADIAVKAARFALLDRSDRKLRVSGDGRFQWADGRGRVTGAFNVDSGLIDIGSTDMPKLSDDVVIVGRTEKKGAGERGLPVAIDVAIALGQGISLKGRGLDATLGGDLRLLSAVGEPLQARGTLRVTKGTFSAYGRNLAIEQGVLRFNGPINNPSLDITAMRRGQEVAAGVAVRGTALAPRVTLVSDPEVSDAEKLSWLVLGHGLGTTSSESDVGALQSAAASLLSQGAASGVQSQLASRFGLDQLSVGTDKTNPNPNLQERIVTVGKQVSSRLFVGFERGLQNATSVLQLRYTLGSRFSLEAETGTRSALSLFYTISYD